MCLISAMSSFLHLNGHGSMYVANSQVASPTNFYIRALDYDSWVNQEFLTAISALVIFSSLSFLPISPFFSGESGLFVIVWMQQDLFEFRITRFYEPAQTSD